MLPPVKRITRPGARPTSASRATVLAYINYPTDFDSTQAADGAGGLGHRGAAAGELRRPALGLLGAQPRPRPVQGPLALGRGAGQGRADHRRLVGDRQGDRGQGRRGRRDGAAGRPLASRSSRRPRPRSRTAGGTAHIHQLRPLRHRGRRADGRGGARPSTAASTSSSTTPAARSAARSSSPTTASTTSSARCSSTTSARCG